MNNERAELIRKAMQRNALKYMSLFGELQDAQEAIAKRDAALAADKAGSPDQAAKIRAMWFYDLRAKAADDTAERSDDQAAANLLGHASVATTKRHYLRRGRVVPPTK
jgi:integrase